MESTCSRLTGYRLALLLVKNKGPKQLTLLFPSVPISLSVFSPLSASIALCAAQLRLTQFPDSDRSAHYTSPTYIRAGPSATASDRFHLSSWAREDQYTMSRTTLPLLSVNGNPYAISFEEAETKAHINYALLEEDHGPAPSISTDALPLHITTVDLITVIDSVRSGVGRDNRDIYATVLAPLFKKLAIKHTYTQTKSASDITNFARSLDLSKSHTIVLISGDTSVYELYNGLFSQHYTGTAQPLHVALIPFGSGNSISLSSGISSIETAIQYLFTSSTSTSLPFYKATLPPGTHTTTGTPITTPLLFSVTLTFAIHANLVWVAEQPDLRDVGIDRFKIAAARVLEQDLTVPLSLTCATTGSPSSSSKQLTKSTAHAYLNVLAVPCIEKGYYISPNSHIDNQQLHIIHFDVAPPDDLMSLLSMPYQGPQTQHIHHPSVEYIAVPKEESIFIEFLDERVEKSTCCIDGIVVRVDDPKGKRVQIDSVTRDEIGFDLKVVGMNAI